MYSKSHVNELQLLCSNYLKATIVVQSAKECFRGKIILVYIQNYNPMKVLGDYSQQNSSRQCGPI